MAKCSLFDKRFVLTLTCGIGCSCTRGPLLSVTQGAAHLYAFYRNGWLVRATVEKFQKQQTARHESPIRRPSRSSPRLPLNGCVPVLRIIRRLLLRQLLIYFWSSVLAMDMFNNMFKQNPLNDVGGRSYRHPVLEKGGSQDKMETFVQFLGRKPSSEAYYRSLGLD